MYDDITHDNKEKSLEILHKWISVWKEMKIEMSTPQKSNNGGNLIILFCESFDLAQVVFDQNWITLERIKAWVHSAW